MPGFFDKKRDVFYFHIWPKCSFNDLLRMRRSSPFGRSLVNDYLQGNPGRVPELEINESKDRNMDKFLEMGIPVTKVFLNNSQSGVGYYSKWSSSVTKFLDLYGSKITHLRVDTFSMLPNREEVGFLDRLSGLESFTVRNWIRRDIEDDDKFTVSFPGDFPGVFKQLKTFDMAQETVWNMANLQNPHLTNASIGIMRHLSWPKLSFLALPMTPSHQVELDAVALAVTRNMTAAKCPEFALFHFLVQLTANLFTEEDQLIANLQVLKKISFEHCYYFDQSTETARDMERIASQPFLQLASHCLQNNILLEMVNAAWFMYAKTRPPMDYGKIVKSLVDLHPTVLGFADLYNLERLTISTSRSCVLQYIEDFEDDDPDYGFHFSERPEWPLLKVLWLTVDSTFASTAHEVIDHTPDRNGGDLDDYEIRHYPKEAVTDLLWFLFGGEVYENLSELKIEFKDTFGLWRIHNFHAQSIADSCVNVRKLELTNWTGTNLGITYLWAGMKCLEEVTIRNCKKLGNVAFVGEDAGNPVFHRLTNLKKLSLLGLDTMPKLTDTLFRLVLSQMKLTHLNLSSENPLRNVTVNGIRSLLAVPFASSIVKFLFRNWSLDGVTVEEFDELSKEFRSSKML